MIKNISDHFVDADTSDDHGAVSEGTVEASVETTEDRPRKRRKAPPGQRKIVPTGLTRQRYSANPFVEDGAFVVPTRRKREQLMTMGPAAVVADGEKIDVAQVVRVRMVDSERFVKLFVDKLSIFFDLTPSSIRLLTVLIEVVSEARHMNTDRIPLTEGIAAEIMREHGEEALSSASYYRALNELVAAGFIAPSATPPLYWLNPAVLFNGDRMRFVDEIRREKNAPEIRAGKQHMVDQNKTRLRVSQETAYDPETGEIHGGGQGSLL